MMSFREEDKKETPIQRTLDDMKETLKSLADSYSSLTVEVIKSGVRVEGIVKILDSHGAQIAKIKTYQDSCPARHQIKGVWSRLKHFENFKEMIMSQTKEDSKAIDVYAQRVQHAAEMAATQNISPVWKDIITKVVIWLLIGILAGASLSSILVYEYVTGKSAPSLTGK